MNFEFIQVKFLLALFLFLSCTITAYGQRARLFSTDSELSNSLIGDILQDHEGIIWMITEDGINKYDGSKFTVYKEKEDGILNNYVRLAFEDSDYNLFFGFYNGLQVYNRAEDSFTTIPLRLENGAEYPAHVLTVHERKDGTLLVGTSGQGIFSIISNNGKFESKRVSHLEPSNFINNILEDHNQNLWISTQDQGLFCVKPDGSTKNYGIGNNITSICQDNLGNIYVGSISKGLFRYNEINDQFSQVPFEGSKPPSISELFATKENQLLVGTDGQGMKLYNASKNIISDINFNISNFDFSKSKVHSIIEDKVGNYWLGLFQKGVVLIPSRINNFKYIGYQSVSNNVIGSNYIMSVLKDHEGTLWVGTDSDGLYGVRDSNEEVAHLSPGKRNPSAPNTIMCMYEDSNNTLWIGSYLNGISKLDRESGKFEHFTAMVDQQGNPIQRIFSITEDKRKNLWVGTLGYGLYSLDLESGHIKNYHGIKNSFHDTDATNNLHNSWINCLLVSKSERIYIGTADGVSYFDPNTKTFTVLNTKHPSLAGQIITTLYEDTFGRIWIGTTRALMCYDPADSSLLTFTTTHGLPSDNICSIEGDTNQNLWVSTNYGISKFNIKNNSFINFYYNDGLQGNEFSKRASYKDDQGTIFFGGINGITYFKPEDIKDNFKTLDVKVTGFYLQNTPVHKGIKSGDYDIVSTSVMNADTFHLAHNDNSFTIEFSAMEYVNPKRIVYLYALQDNNWINLQQGTNTVTFNDLEPGKYQFKVRAKDFSTYSDTRTFLIIIHPAWYFSAWAKLGYALISLVIVLAIVYQIRQRYETRRKMREHRHAEQINEAKLEFFTNISHEIRTPLSLIINPLKKLITNDADTDRQRSYSVMRRNSERILHLVNQLMDLRKIDKGKINLRFKETDIVQFVRDTTEIFQEQILAKHLIFEIRHADNIPHVWIDQNYFDKTIHNLLSNAIKFAPQSGEIYLTIETNKDPQDRLTISCIDNGIGLREDELNKIFDRFYQAPGTHTHGIGTGIGLHLTRSIVELHHGTINAENNKSGAGCKFVISIPLGNDHLNPEEIVIETQNRKVIQEVEPVVSLPHAADEKFKIKSKSKNRVLVVDDDEEVRDYICSELASQYHMIKAQHGKEGLAIALEKKPDLIISDVVMPEMDGISLCKKIKQNVNINHIPVILLTAKSGEQDNLAGLGIGADAYIAKPFNMAILSKTAENIIRNRALLRNNYSGNQQQSEKVENIEVKSADEKLMQKIMNVINLNVSNPDLNVEMIAAEIGISRVHLYRKLKELTNQSVRDLIKNIRLEQAAKLLSTKQISVSEVAYATGFSNPSKFSSSFKAFYGISPKAYMEKHLQKEES